MTRRFPRGLYAVADTECAAPGHLVSAAQHAILGGARAVQYRDRLSGRRLPRREAASVRDVCQDHGVPFILWGDVRLADELGADGVHLERDGMSVEDARKVLGEERLIGVACGVWLPRAVRAVESGADYVAFGNFFPAHAESEEGARASLSLLSDARAAIDATIVATGGLTPQNSRALIAAGADSLAVSRGLFDLRDAESAAHHFAVLFD